MLLGQSTYGDTGKMSTSLVPIFFGVMNEFHWFSILHVTHINGERLRHEIRVLADRRNPLMTKCISESEKYDLETETSFLRQTPVLWFPVGGPL